MDDKRYDDSLNHLIYDNNDSEIDDDYLYDNNDIEEFRTGFRSSHQDDTLDGNNYMNEASDETLSVNIPQSDYTNNVSTDTIASGKNSKGGKVHNHLLSIILIIICIILLLIILFLLFNKKYEVNFQSEGGTLVDTITVSPNKTIKRPQDPSREGYRFIGWYYNNEEFDFNTKIDKNIVLIARWEQVGDIQLETTNLDIFVGEVKQIKVTVREPITEDELVWLSSDENIVKVDNKGNITALKPGKVTITIRSKDGKTSAAVLINSTIKIIDVTELAISGASDVTVGRTIKLNAVVTPNDATDKSVKWSSSNAGIAKVDQSGTVTGVSVGSVIITATSADGKITAKKTINVKAVVHATGVTISGANSVVEGQTITLTANISPSNTTDKGVRWSSDNASIATVDQNGNVRGVSPGTVTITVTTVDGNKQASYQVTVKEKPATFIITFTPINTTVGTMQYTVSVTRNGVAFTNYTWVEYGNNPGPYKQNVDSSKIDRSITSAVITLTDGSKVTATVKYN